MRKIKNTGKKSKIIVFGAGEIAELAAYYFDVDSDYEVVGFVVDDEYATTSTLSGLPLVPWTEVKSTYPVTQYKLHVALGYTGLNQLRADKFNQCKDAGFELVSYISSKATTFSDLNLGINCFILENQNIQPRVEIGNNVMLWSGNHIGHGARIRDHVYISSHAVISGHVEIGERCFIGVNASIRDFVKIEKGSFIGMGSIVTKNVSEGSVILPSKSEVITGSDPRAQRLIKSTFGTTQK